MDKIKKIKIIIGLIYLVILSIFLYFLFHNFNLEDISSFKVIQSNQDQLNILKENNLGLTDIQSVISGMSPMEGAIEFVTWLKERFQLVILSDTFYEFSEPLMRQLGLPTLFCHRLIVDSNGTITDYRLRQKDPKRQCVKAFHSLNFRVIASGDSYNDTTMLSEAEAGILFRAPANVIEEFPQYPSVSSYEELKMEFLKASERDLSYK